MRLLTRTTRSVEPTDAGEQLLQSFGPMLRDLDRRIEALSDLHDRPHGSFRITAVEHAARTVLAPKLAELLKQYPDINAEVVVDYGLVDIVADRLDAGVRLGEAVAKDMIAVRISPEVPMAIVGSPEYFAKHGTPRNAQQLADHRAVNLRLTGSGTLNAWRLIQNGREIKVRVDGSLAFNNIDPILEAALGSVGMAYLPLDQVEQYLTSEAFVQVFRKSTPPLPGYHLYYPSRRHASLVFKLLVHALRIRCPYQSDR